jgi:dephospho-CoA kinase
MIIGLSGGYCAGKNLAASLLEEEGFSVLDVDKLGHVATIREKEKIIARFGENLRGPDGEVDRKALGQLVFKDKRALRDLEAIIHPAANALAEEWIAAQKSKRLCLNAALLHRMPAIERLDFIIEIRAPLVLRLLRARKRDGLGFTRALARIHAQRDFPRILAASGRPVLRVGNAGSVRALRGALARALEKGEAISRGCGETR